MSSLQNWLLGHHGGNSKSYKVKGRTLLSGDTIGFNTPLYFGFWYSEWPTPDDQINDLKRVNIRWYPIADNVVANSVPIEFPEATEDLGEVQHLFMVYKDEKTGRVVYDHCEVRQPVHIAKGDIPIFDVGALKIYLTHTPVW